MYIRMWMPLRCKRGEGTHFAWHTNPERAHLFCAETLCRSAQFAQLVPLPRSLSPFRFKSSTFLPHPHSLPHTHASSLTHKCFCFQFFIFYFFFSIFFLKKINKKKYYLKTYCLLALWICVCRCGPFTFSTPGWCVYSPLSVISVALWLLLSVV